MKKRTYICFAGMLIMLLLTGCGTQTASLKYEPYTGRIQENTEEAELEKTVWKDHTYYFATAISYDDRRQFAEQATAFAEQVDRELGGQTKLTFYVTEDVVTKGDAGEVWINTVDVNTMSAYTAILQAYATEQANYGMAYGLACYICEQLELDVEIPAGEIDLTAFGEKGEPQQMLELSLPRFDKRIEDEDEIHKIQQLAKCLMRERIEEKGFAESFSDYAKATVYYNFVKNTGDRSDTFPYCFETEYARYYFALESIQEKFLTCFENAHTYIETAETDMWEARELLKENFVYEPETMPIYFIGSFELAQGGTLAGNYAPDENIFVVEGGFHAYRTTIVHEYVHYLTLYCCDCEELAAQETWLKESVTEYIALYCLKNATLGTWKYETAEPEDLFRKLWKIQDKEELDLIGINDFRALQYYYGARNGRTYLSVSGRAVEREEGRIQQARMSYEEGASFVYYLVETYGEEKMKELTMDAKGDVNKVYGKKFYELYEEWAEYMTEKYQDVLPYILGQ